MNETDILQKLIVELIDDIKNRDISSCVLKDLFNDSNVYDLFATTITLSSKEIEQQYTTAAHEQFQMGIPYSQYSNLIYLFSTEIINKAAVIVNDSKLIERINKIKNIVINSTAHGYLLEIIGNDIPSLNIQINEYVAVEHINDHLHWMKRMIYDIENNVDATIELNSCKCNFGTWLATNEIDQFFSPSEVADIHVVHKNIHNSAESLYYNLKLKSYHHVLLDYLFLSRISINLVSRLNNNITHKILTEQVETDALTKLKNRHALDKELEQLFKNKDNNFCITMLDIDHFKTVNDTFGHQAGDSVLIELAEILKNNLRSTDTIFRYGGEEFLIVFNNCEFDIALDICEKLRHKIENHIFEKALKNHTITASFGIAMVSEELNQQNLLIERADIKLYEAKNSGRNRVSY